jgi:glycerol uptake facilitator-like aquaporin
VSVRRVAAEAIGTFFLVLVGPGSAMVDAWSSSSLGISGIALAFGPLTGASMNPARSFGPALVGGLWLAHWVYWLAPVTAMIVAARTYDLLRTAQPPGVGPVDAVVGLQGSVSDRIETS